MVERLRWKQRHESFIKALGKLDEALLKKNLNQLEMAGLVKTFEFTWELAWKTIKDYLTHQGIEISGPRDALKQGFKSGLIAENDVWLDLLESRNLMARVYDEVESIKMIQLIRDQYTHLFKDLDKRLKQK